MRRVLTIGLGIAAMLAALVLATRDDTSHVNTPPRLVLRPTPTPALFAVSTPTTVPSFEPGEFFAVQSGAGFVAYDTATARPQFNLPPGLPSADWTHFYSVRFERNRTTILLQTFTPGGRSHSAFTLDGQWALGAVSAAGQWLAVQRIASVAEMNDWAEKNIWNTQIQVLDGTKGTVLHALDLDGNFDIDAVSADGTTLFLIQHLPVINPTHYSIRLYDLTTERFKPGALRGQTGMDDILAGMPWGSVSSPDGHWLLTLYLNPSNSSASIEALNLRDKRINYIGLPSQGDLEQLKNYTLALAPDSMTLYAANPMLGLVVQIDLSRQEIVQTVRFDRHVERIGDIPSSYVPSGHALVSQDGARVYFSDGDDVWVYVVNAQKVLAAFQDSPIVGLGESPSSGRLYVVTPLPDYTTGNAPGHNLTVVVFGVKTNGALSRLN